MPTIAAQLDALAALPESELGAEWQKVYRSSPPRLPASLLRMGVAYRLQELAHGKMSRSVARVLTTGGRAPLEAKTGTRFVREWDGRTIDVIVTERGMVWEGRTYRSLSAIAREVTGTSWSGPRFFGLGKYD